MPIGIDTAQENKSATKVMVKVSGTLADQARALHRSTATAANPAPRVTSEAPAHAQPSRRAIDRALENLSFIGSETVAEVAPHSPGAAAPDTMARPALGSVKRHPLDSIAPFSQSAPEESEQVDRDIPEPAANAATFNAEGLGKFEVDCIDDSDYRLPEEPSDSDDPVPGPGPALARRPFSSSLNTAGEDRD